MSRPRPWLFVFSCCALSACDSAATWPPQACEAQAGAATATRPSCLDSIATNGAWHALSVAVDPATDEPSLRRWAEALLPADPRAPMGAVFLSGQAPSGSGQDATHVYLSSTGQADALLEGASRSFYACRIEEREQAALGTIFVYSVTDPQSLTCAQHGELARALAKHFTIGLLYLRVGNGFALADDCDVPTLLVNETRVDYEAYTEAAAFGVVRVYNRAQLATAINSFDFNWQNLLVLEETPYDIQTVIAGAVTGTRQGQLSHLNVRSAARGTPNCFVRNAHTRLAAWEGQLVRLSCAASDVQIRVATLDEANAWRAAFRRPPQDLPAFDTSAVDLPDLLSLPTASANDRARNVTRFGAKGSNLATLYQRIPATFALDGFLIPVAAYIDHLERATVRIGLTGGMAFTGSVRKALQKLTADVDFRSDIRNRRTQLERIMQAIKTASCSNVWMDRIGRTILSRPGGKNRMWRFRSSSNAEDILTFSGAGLYTSEEGCFADDYDSDGEGPSLCDREKRQERTVCSALKAVWASLWSLRAWEERDFAGISPFSVAMGVLVNERSKDENANLVVFSGDPNLKGDPRFLVDAQIGALEVVAPEEGTWPETSRLKLQDGKVVQIERLRRSSAADTVVVADESLRALGEAYASFIQTFPIDDVAPAGKDIILDSEWKILANGRLVIKQIRPFLR